MVVTGGSRGIGAAVCRLAAARGYGVIVNFAADRSGALEVVDSIQRQGGKAFAYQADVSIEDQVVSLFAAALRAFGRIDCLVNNAGVTGPISRLEDLSTAVLRRVVDVNVLGTIFCCREAVRLMSTRRGGQGGTIVNLSSRSAQRGGAGEWVHYAATKGALETLTLGLAQEVAAEGIRVNAVAPGLINTGLHEAAGDPERVARMAGSIPMGRAGSAQEVAEAVVWLASPAASYVTGTVMQVAGGR
jgi:NAD(P)-dependent dehydrogenase (short-subunit alcohol dehydrogenase family)